MKPEIKEALDTQRQALNRMELEIIHYRQTGVGLQFLEQAWEDVKEANLPFSQLSGITL